MNRLLIIGNIVKDAEVRKTQTGKTVLNFSVADNDKLKKTVMYHNVGYYVESEKLAPYLKKGTKVAVTGVLSEYTKKDKSKGYSVLANHVELLTKADAQEDDSFQNVPDDVSPFM